MKYIKKPLVVEAQQYVKYGHLVKGMCNSQQCFDEVCSEPHVHTIHNKQHVKLDVGDWIIPEPDGEHFYPCKPAVFEATYDNAADVALNNAYEARQFTKDKIMEMVEKMFEQTYKGEGALEDSPNTPAAKAGCGSLSPNRQCLCVQEAGHLGPCVAKIGEKMFVRWKKDDNATDVLGPPPVLPDTHPKDPVALMPKVQEDTRCGVKNETYSFISCVLAKGHEGPHCGASCNGELKWHDFAGGTGPDDNFNKKEADAIGGEVSS